jgi:hypothetical protein
VAFFFRLVAVIIFYFANKVFQFSVFLYIFFLLFIFEVYNIILKFLSSFELNEVTC